MSDDSGETTTLPISRYPGPACGYAIESEVIPILSTNDSFTDRFGPISERTCLREIFQTRDLQIAETATDLEPHLQRDGEFEVVVPDPDGDTAFLVTAIAPVGNDPGFLLFAEQSEDSASDMSSALGIDHVASVLSHDLRNPLDVAKARLDAGRELDEDEHFEHVEQAHDRMERIIQDVLTMARGEEVVEPDETVALSSVARQAWDSVESESARLTIEDELPEPTADPDRLTRLFENLFRNSIEHGQVEEDEPVEMTRDTPNGVRIRVGTLDESGTGFYVADDGPGIPPADRDRVFEPGYSSEEHGIGLGLAIVAQIADLHGWSVTIESSAQDGARFEFDGLETS